MHNIQRFNKILDTMNLHLITIEIKNFAPLEIYMWKTKTIRIFVYKRNSIVEL